MILSRPKQFVPVKNGYEICRTWWGSLNFGFPKKVDAELFINGKGHLKLDYKHEISCYSPDSGSMMPNFKSGLLHREYRFQLASCR